MSWEPVGFMVFSNLEAFAWCALCMSIFRFKTSDYAWQILVVVTLMNLQSFVLRNELSLSYLVPLINILFITFLFSTIVRVSLLGSLTIASAGLVVFGFIQTALAIVLLGQLAQWMHQLPMDMFCKLALLQLVCHYPGFYTVTVMDFLMISRDSA